MARDDGGPAFPVEDLSKTQCPGITLRDYFAGQALAGMLAHPDCFGDEGLAPDAYNIADAMLAQRTADTEEEG